MKKIEMVTNDNIEKLRLNFSDAKPKLERMAKVSFPT